MNTSARFRIALFAASAAGMTLAAGPADGAAAAPVPDRAPAAAP